MKFRTVTIPDVLGSIAANSNPYLDAFVSAVNIARAEKAKVYQTYVRGKEGEEYTFVTTHKDSHLELGLLSFEGQLALAKFLQHEFSKGDAGQLLLNFRREKSEPKESKGVSVLVSFCQVRGEISFGFAPAH